MSVLRKLSAVELSGVTTFGSLCGSLLKTVQSYASKSCEIHLVLENYKDKSPKSTERPRRATELGPLFDILSDDQPLPDMKKFFSRMENKKSLQHFLVHYCIKTYTSYQPLYIAGGDSKDPN